MVLVLKIVRNQYVVGAGVLFLIYILAFVINIFLQGLDEPSKSIRIDPAFMALTFLFFQWAEYELKGR